MYSCLFRKNITFATYSIKTRQIRSLFLFLSFLCVCVRHTEILNIIGFGNQIPVSIDKSLDRW